MEPGVTRPDRRQPEFTGHRAFTCSVRSAQVVVGTVTANGQQRDTETGEGFGAGDQPAAVDRGGAFDSRWSLRPTVEQCVRSARLTSV